MATMSQSFSMPNLPGMIPNRRGWLYREKEGFRRSTSRPGTAQGGSRPASPSYERSHIFDAPFAEETQRPSTAHVLTIGLPGNSHGVALLSRPSTAGPFFSSQQRPQSSSAKLPRYVETDRQVARFFAYFYELRPWDRESPLGETLLETHICRPVVIHYYIFDDTIEINEPKVENSGLPQGNFYKRGKARKGDGSALSLADLAPGNRVAMLGQDFFVTDADNFTRDYFKRELNMVLPPALKTPPSIAPDIAAQYATGLGPALPALNHNKTFNTRSTDYFATKEQLSKTQLFLRFEGKVLRFLCLEVSAPSPPFFPRLQDKLLLDGRDLLELSNGHGFVASDSVRKFAFSYYLAHGTMDLVVQKGRGERDQGGGDEPKLILKKTKMPKNWRLVQSHGQQPRYYEAQDFQLGEVLDIYGRYFLLVNCDSFTRRVYDEMNIPQREVPLIKEEEEVVVQPIPQMGEDNLPIGSAEDTLATVYGMPRPRKNVAKQYRNQNSLLRCRAVLVTDSPIDRSRSFLLTFYLEDDSLQVYEENVRNSGIWAGNFLKRGKYLNDATGEGLQGGDFFLGAHVCVNGNVFRVVDMDNMSLKFCENYPEEFPMSDLMRIMGAVLVKAVEAGRDLRSAMKGKDKKGEGHLVENDFISLLDSLGLIEDLNDQELLTLLRRFRGGGKDKVTTHGTAGSQSVYYGEMCDLLSHVYFTHSSPASRKSHSSPSALEQFLTQARGRKIMWRRVLRKEPHSSLKGSAITLAVLIAVFTKHGLAVGEDVALEIEEKFRVEDQKASKELSELKNRKADESIYSGLNDKASNRPSHLHRNKNSRVQKKLLDSKAIALRLSEIKKRQSNGNNTSIFRRSSTAESLSVSVVEEGSSIVEKNSKSNVLIDFDKLCDAIYPTDWIVR